VLEGEGWEVCAEAATGREAVAMTAAERPDIVVLDLSMPDWNGVEAARKIHEQFPETAIFILTMHDAAESLLDTRGLGVRACVVKTDVGLLVDEVRRMVVLARRLA
jgi:DNA-binding NarL/FixJ family response regulator